MFLDFFRASCRVWITVGTQIFPLKAYINECMRPNGKLSVRSRLIFLAHSRTIRININSGGTQMFFRGGWQGHIHSVGMGGVKWSGCQAAGRRRSGRFGGEGQADWRGGLAEVQGGANSRRDKFPSPTT